MAEPPLPQLVFFYDERSGPARRMESLLAHVARKERGRLLVRHVEIGTNPRLAEKFCVREAAALVLIQERRVVDRIDGRASMPQIEALLEKHLPVEEPVLLA